VLRKGVHDKMHAHGEEHEYMGKDKIHAHM
jgi:hypothetical protein